MYRRHLQGWARHIDFLILDILCLHVAFYGAYVFRHGWSLLYTNKLYMSMAIMLSLIDVLYIIVLNPYRDVFRRGYYKEFKQTLKQTIFLLFLVSVFMFFTQEGEAFSRITLALTSVFYFYLAFIIRVVWKRHVEKNGDNEKKPSLLIITTDTYLKYFISEDKQRDFQEYLINGYAVINKNYQNKSFFDLNIVANRETVIEYICREWIDEVFISLPNTEPFPDVLINACIEMGVTVHLSLENINKLEGKKQFVETIANRTVLTSSINTIRTSEWIIKRLIDIAGGLVGCLITGILFIFIAPAIYSQSPGPIFFKQVRMGRNGKPFNMYKFRSMYMDAEKRKADLLEQNTMTGGFMFKLDYDPRIIGCRKLANGTIQRGIGNKIRDWSLDEFPQFFNVLRGDMSLVGTRPPTLDEWNKYELHHRARLAFKPGLTGLWQVSGRSNIKDFEEVVKLDKEYIENWDLGQDIKILAKTVRVVFSKEGSK